MLSDVAKNSENIEEILFKAALMRGDTDFVENYLKQKL